MVYLIDGVEGAWCLATKAGQQVHLGLELWPDGTMQFWCATACQAVNDGRHAEIHEDGQPMRITGFRAMSGADQEALLARLSSLALTETGTPF